MQLAADLALGGNLRGFVAERRRDRRSWRLIARDLLDATDGRIDVTGETVRAWFPDLADTEPTKAAS